MKSRSKLIVKRVSSGNKKLTLAESIKKLFDEVSDSFWLNKLQLREER